MSGKYGADVAQLRQLSKQLESSARRLENARSEISARLPSPAWFGPDASYFEIEWYGNHCAQLKQAETALHEAAKALSKNALEQEQASTDGGALLGSTVNDHAPYDAPENVTVDKRGDSAFDDPPFGASSPGDIIREFAKKGGYESGITIRTIINPDGTQSHIIYIPGTQKWKGRDEGTFDGEDNPWAFLGGQTNSSRAIMEAMRQHGIGPNDPIMLAGHSQGALIAGNIAGNKEFNANYNLQGVLMYGADATDRNIPSHVAVTHVSNRLDPVKVGTSLGNMLKEKIKDPLNPLAGNPAVGYLQDKVSSGGHDITIPLWGVESDNSRNPIKQHTSHEGYAKGADSWFKEPGNHTAWESAYGSFIPGAGAASQVSRYKFTE